MGDAEGLRGRCGAVAEDRECPAVQSETDAIRGGIDLATEAAVDVGPGVVEDEGAAIEDIVGGEEAVRRAAVGQSPLPRDEDTVGVAGAGEGEVAVADLGDVEGVRGCGGEAGEGAVEGGVRAVVTHEQGTGGAGGVRDRAGAGEGTKEGTGSVEVEEGADGEIKLRVARTGEGSGRVGADGERAIVDPGDTSVRMLGLKAEDTCAGFGEAVGAEERCGDV